MKNENLIHIKLDYEEALQSRKDLLYTEKALIMSAEAIGRYHSSRIDELNMKIKLHRKMKELITILKRIQKDIPDVEFSGMPKKKELERPKITVKKYDSSIKSQLQEIQRKLNSLQ